MSNPSRDSRVTVARQILAETHRLHTHGCTRQDLLFYIGRLQEAGRLLLEHVDEPPRQPRIPDTAHTFVSTDGETYRCTRCGRVADRHSVWNLSVLEECEGGQQ